MKKPQPVPPPKVAPIHPVLQVIVYGLFGMFVVGMFAGNSPRSEQVSSTSTKTPATSPQPDSDRILLGNSDTGYSLWLDKSNGCVYVKDLSEGDLRRLGVSLSQFKQSVKQETGARCVFFE